MQVIPVGEEDGLGRARKRLELLYAGKHELKMVEEPEIFIVHLEMELEKENVASADSEGNEILLTTTFLPVSS